MLRWRESRWNDAAGELVVSLDSTECASPAEVGWKAARLARLMHENARHQAPFRVPGGVVVTTAA